MNDKNKLTKILSDNKLDAILISSVSNIIYFTNYSGFSSVEREAFLVISKARNYLITDGRYSEAVSKIAGFELLEISNKTSLDKIFKSISQKLKIIGVEENDIRLAEYKKLKKYFKVKNLKEVGNLRIEKTGQEISQIEKSCRIGDKSFEYILGKLKTGISEKQIAHELEMFIKSQNAELSFPSIVAFGKNSSMPHHKTGDEKLKANSIVLLDFGVKLDNYCSDMTRTVFFGKAEDKFKKIYNTVLQSQKLAIEQLNNPTIRRKQIKASQIDKAARDHIVEQGFPTIPHSLGHGIGIEVHEQPRLSPKSKNILKPGMVFSVEPGIYTPGYGGVRIEDLVVLENKSVRPLTHSPKSLLEI